MPVQNPQDAFLFDLSITLAGEHTALRILEQGAGEVADERARVLLARHAEETRAQIEGIEQVFSLLRAEPQDLGCPAIEGIRQELDLFRRQDPAPEYLTTAVLFENLKIEHNEIATYELLVDKAILLEQVGAAQILATIGQQEQDTAAKVARLIHELLLEQTGRAPVWSPDSPRPAAEPYRRPPPARERDRAGPRGGQPERSQVARPHPLRASTRHRPTHQPHTATAPPAPHPSGREEPFHLPLRGRELQPWGTRPCG